MVATCLPIYNIYTIQHAFLLQVAVNMDKAACHLSNISSKRCARACTGAAGMLEPCSSHGLVHDDQQSILISLIFMLKHCLLHQTFSRKLQIFEQKHTKPLREYVNKERRIFGRFSFAWFCFPPKKWGRWLEILVL